MKWLHFWELKFSRIWFEKCLEILKIFSKNSNSWYIVIHLRAGFEPIPLWDHPIDGIKRSSSRPLADIKRILVVERFQFIVSTHPELYNQNYTFFKIATFSLSFFIYKPNWSNWTSLIKTVKELISLYDIWSIGLGQIPRVDILIMHSILAKPENFNSKKFNCFKKVYSKNKLQKDTALSLYHFLNSTIFTIFIGIPSIEIQTTRSLKPNSPKKNQKNTFQYIFIIISCKSNEKNICFIKLRVKCKLHATNFWFRLISHKKRRKKIKIENKKMLMVL